MAKRLQAQKRSEYNNPPKACPRPADLLIYPNLMALVSANWRNRLDMCRSGAASRARADAKRACAPRARQGKYAKKKGA